VYCNAWLEVTLNVNILLLQSNESLSTQEIFCVANLSTCQLFTHTVEDSKKTYLNQVKSEENVSLMMCYINNKESTNLHSSHGKLQDKWIHIYVV